MRDDDPGQVVGQRSVNYNTSTDLDRFQYAYDRNSSRLGNPGDSGVAPTG